MSKNTRINRITQEEKKVKLKIARPVPEFEIYHTRKWCDKNERQKCVSKEHKPYIRGKRGKAQQPNSYDTQWIDTVSLKSWKHTSRKKKQWMKHKISKSEWVAKHQEKIDRFFKKFFGECCNALCYGKSSYYTCDKITDVIIFKWFRKDVEDFKD